MTPEERILISQELSQLQSFPGWRHVLRICREVSNEAWEEFIALPVDKKTSKASFDAQGRYKAPGLVLDRINDEIRSGQQDAKRLEAKQ